MGFGGRSPSFLQAAVAQQNIAAIIWEAVSTERVDTGVAIEAFELELALHAPAFRDV